MVWAKVGSYPWWPAKTLDPQVRRRAALPAAARPAAAPLLRGSGGRLPRRPSALVRLPTRRPVPPAPPPPQRDLSYPPDADPPRPTSIPIRCAPSPASPGPAGLIPTALHAACVLL